MKKFLIIISLFLFPISGYACDTLSVDDFYDSPKFFMLSNTDEIIQLVKNYNINYKTNILLSSVSRVYIYTPESSNENVMLLIFDSECLLDQRNISLDDLKKLITP